MLKNILNLKGAQQLSKKEQSSINGGVDTDFCKRNPQNTPCGLNAICCGGVCQSGNTCL